MSAAPDVAVIIPCYNVAGYVGTALESVLAQTHGALEILVVDDGSTDDGPERLASFRDPRLRIARLPHRGLAAVRNYGLAATTAPYVAFLDGDDAWHPEKIERHVALMERRPEIDLSFSHSVWIDRSGRTLPFLGNREEGPVRFEELFAENHVRHGSAAVIRRSALEAAGEFDTELRAASDVDMWLRLALVRDANVYCIAEPLTCYRRREDQATGDWRRVRDALATVASRVESMAPGRVGAETRRLAAVNTFRYLSFLALEGGEFSDSRKLLRESFRSGRRFWLGDVRSWLLLAVLIAGLPFPPGMRLRIRDGAHSALARLGRGPAARCGPAPC